MMRCIICQTNAHTTDECASVIKSSQIGSLYGSNITPTMRKRSEFVPTIQVLFTDGEVPLPFPCLVKFEITPYEGTLRTAVYPCKDLADVLAKIDFYMDDSTGNTKSVRHSLYVKPNVKGAC